MIVMKFRGGLGNQLFQYHAGMFFSKLIGTEIYYDVSEYNLPQNNMYRPFLLPYFAINLNMIVKRERSFFTKWFKRNEKVIRLSDCSFVDGQRIINNQVLSIYNEDENIWPHDNQYINGYFANEKYLDLVEPLKVRDDLDDKNNELLSLIEGCNSVSVHFRRTDYLLSMHEAYQNICTDKYYLFAINYMNEILDDPVYFVFSDDPDYALSFVKDRCPKIKYYLVDINKSCIDSYKDLFLMSRCNSNIIANSTFSWWAAYYNNNVDKHIVCPTKFQKYELKNMYPSGWYRIES